MSKEAIEEIMRRAVENAARAEANPAGVLATYEGRSRSGTMTVWVDYLGRLRRLAIEPGSVQEGDELGIATALMEAYTEARKTATEMAAAGLVAYQREQNEAPARAAPARPRPADDEFDPEDPLFLRDHQ